VQRVLLVHELPGGFGGAERYLQALAGSLMADGVEVAVLVFVREQGGAALLAERLEAAAVPTTVVQGRGRPGPIRRAIRASRPEVLHWTFVDPHAFHGAALLLLPWGLPLVITEHLPMLRAGRHRRITRDLANRRMAMAIVVGAAGAEEVRRAWPHPPPTTVVDNGVPLATPSARRPPVAARRPARLLFVGRLTDQKGVLELPAVVAALATGGRDVALRVLGEGPQEGELRELAGRVAKGTIELLGFGDPAAELAAADVLLVPSHWEGGFPLSAREALATGVPVVCSDIPPHHDLGEHAAAVRVVASRSADEWATAVGEVLDALPAAGAAALAVAAGATVEHMVAETRVVYDRVASGRGTPT